MLRGFDRTLIPTRLTCKPASSQSECHRIRHGAGFKAFQPADALGAADIFRDTGDINRAFRFTTIAMRAAITIDDHLQGGYLIENNEQCAHWAKVFAPEAFHKHRGDDKGEKDTCQKGGRQLKAKNRPRRADVVQRWINAHRAGNQNYGQNQIF